jgi:hypothetical protein
MRRLTESSLFHKQWDGQPPWEPHPSKPLIRGGELPEGILGWSIEEFATKRPDSADVFQKQIATRREQLEEDSE